MKTDILVGRLPLEALRKLKRGVAFDTKKKYNRKREKTLLRKEGNA